MRRRGGTAIEMALIFPLLLVMVCAILDFAWYLHRRNMAGEAAVAGARAASLVEDPATVSSTASSVVSARLTALGLDPHDATVSATFVTGATDDLVRVDVALAHSSLTGLVPVPATIDAKASAVYEDVGG